MSYYSPLNLCRSPDNPLMNIIYGNVFPAVMSNHVARMPKPKEVLVEVDETGSVVSVAY